MDKRPRAAGTRRRGAAAALHTHAHVHVWGHHVAVVAESARREITFEYTDEIRASGLELSPIHLPVSRKGPINFPGLQRIDSFAGLPGLLADALPDAFGNAVIKRYFAQRGTPDAALSPVQRLLYIGTRAMGALEFSPPLDGRVTPDTTAALEIAALVEQARRVIEGDTAVAVPEIIRVGASAGGARAKALILWNRSTSRVKSAFAPYRTGDEHWLIKFDGVSANEGGHSLSKEFVPGPYGRIEYAYSRMARTAGIEMADTHLLREREFAHFMTQRFDRVGDARLHMHTLGGLHHVDYNVRQAMSYEEYFRTVRLLGMGQEAIAQAFRRMVFNIMARNQDDHVKNLSFLMDANGVWRLSPAYDVTWAFGTHWTATHQMTAAGKDDAFTRADLLAIGDMFDLRRGGADIVAEVEAALDTWAIEAREAELDHAWTARIRATFRILR